MPTPSSGSNIRVGKQPGDVGAGLSAAYAAMKRGLNQAATTIVTIPMREYKRSGTKVGCWFCIESLMYMLLWWWLCRVL